MKIPWNRNYLIIAFHIVITILVIAIVGGMIFQLSEAKNVILETAGRFLAVFSPLLFGIFFAVLLEPMTSFFQEWYEKKRFLKNKGTPKNRKVGTTIVYIFVIMVLGIGGGISH